MIRLTEKDRRLDKLPAYCHKAGAAETNHPSYHRRTIKSEGFESRLADNVEQGSGNKGESDSITSGRAALSLVSFRSVLQDILCCRLLRLLRMSVMKIADIATREGNGNSGMVFDPPTVTVCALSI